MSKMSYSEQLNVIANMFKEKTERLKNMPIEEAREYAREELISIGVFDSHGNLTPQYAALKDMYL